MANVKSTRRDKAQATRRAIIRAAHAVFLEAGFHGATVAEIARRAGVASQTVYFVFHNKPELISAVIDTAVMGEDDPVEPQDSPWFAAMLAEPDAAECLRMFVRGTADVFARASGISEVLRAAALTDEEVRATQLRHEDLRRTGFRQVVEMLAEKGTLRAGLEVDTATDVFMNVLGDSTFVQFTGDRGWSHEQVVEWLLDVLPGLLLDES